MFKKYSTYTLLLVCVYIMLSSCNSNPTVVSAGDKDTGEFVEPKTKENPYQKLRNHSFTITAKQLNLKCDSSKTEVLGMMMEWNMGEVIASTVAFKSGDASLYLSTGQIYMGGIGINRVRKAGLDFAKEGDIFLSKAVLSADTTAPSKAMVKFYILTNHGRYVHEESFDKIEKKTSEWLKLFELGNGVIAEYRLSSGQ